ncbi:MAG: hypothetical protein OXD49_13980 [Candidatus Poribacteria bacterium]|nr:hypothetical protein [Candidatus Poribacteria bacterium]
MFDRTAKISKVTWKTILLNPLIFGTMAVSLDSNSVLSLICTGVIVVVSGLMPLGVPRVPRSVLIACGLMFTLGCGIGSLGLGNILERQFPNFPVVSQEEWIRWLPSAFENLAILVWLFVVLHISPVTRSLFMSAIFVAAAAGYALTSDALAIRDALVFGVTREITDWEQAAEFLLNGCTLVVWARLIIRKLASTSAERMIGSCTLFVGATMILGGTFFILWDIFS